MTAPSDAEAARPASPPIHAVTVDWDVRIPARDGTELSANIWRPAPTERRTRTVASPPSSR